MDGYIWVHKRCRTPITLRCTCLDLFNADKDFLLRKRLAWAWKGVE
jgi:hypothetical protein